MAKKRESSLVSALEVLQTVFQKSKGSFSSEYQRMKLEQNWKNIVGEELAKDTSPRKLYKTTLYVAASSSEAQYHFRFSSDVLLERVNQFLGSKVIDNFNFSPAQKKKEYSKAGKKFISEVR